MLVAGTPLDFRLGFGRFGDARVVHLCDAASEIAPHATLAASTAGDLAATFARSGRSGRAARRARRLDRAPARRRAGEARGRAAVARGRLRADQARADLRRAAQAARPRRDRDRRRRRLRLVRGQARRELRAGHVPRPRSVRLPGMGPGYALAAGVAHPDRQVVLLLGDGAIGFALGDFESLVRHGVNVTAIVGNNGIWGLEKHPMQALFGYDVVAELSPGIRYDKVIEALGGHGELVDAARRDRSRARPRVRDTRASRSSTSSPTPPTPTRGHPTSPDPNCGQLTDRSGRVSCPLMAVAACTVGRVRGRGWGTRRRSRRGAAPWPSCASSTSRGAAHTRATSGVGRVAQRVGLDDFADEVHRERLVPRRSRGRRSSARARPRRRRDRAAARTRRRRRCAPGCANRAVVDAMRRSHSTARSKPPASAGPLTDAIVGSGKRSTVSW